MATNAHDLSVNFLVDPADRGAPDDGIDYESLVIDLDEVDSSPFFLFAPTSRAPMRA